MTDVPVDDGLEEPEQTEEQESGRRASGQRNPGPEVEVEREITKRHLIEAISSVVVVILYMVFTLLRDRDGGLVAIDPEDDRGPEDDWAED